MDFDDPDYQEFPSKTQRKKEAHAQQQLGTRLTELPDSTLMELPLSEALLSAIREFKRIPPKRGAVKRQLQFIGRLIRDCDTEAIEHALDSRTAHEGTGRNNPSKLERYCEQLMSEGDTGIQALLETEPELDRQHLRQLLRNIHKATDNKRQAAISRLRTYLESACN